MALFAVRFKISRFSEVESDISDPKSLRMYSANPLMEPKGACNSKDKLETITGLYESLAC